MQRNSKSKCTGAPGPVFVNVSHSVPFSSIRGGGKGPTHMRAYNFLFNVFLIVIRVKIYLEFHIIAALQVRAN